MALCKPYNMDRISVLCAVCLAFLSWCSAAPRSWSGAGKQADTSDQNSTHRQAVNDQEHILSQLLGDYDKVKAISEGSDCRCKCVVRPLSRSACRRIEEGGAAAQDSYTVETISSGPRCKCACIAPPSAVNPCEAEFRLKKLREAGKENVKLSAIIDLLEGSFYGLDLLKLHSVTNKLLGRVEHVEKVVFLNHTGAEAQPLAAPLAQPRVTDRPAAGPSQHLGHEQKAKSLSQKSERAAAYHSPDARYEEKFVGGHESLPTEERSDHAMQEKSVSTPKEETPPQGTSKVLKSAANGMIIRGMTFYKSEPDPMVADDGDPGENLFEYHGFSGDGPDDLFHEEQLLQPRSPFQSRVRMRASLREPHPKTTGTMGGDDHKTRNPTEAKPTAPDQRIHHAPENVQSTGSTIGRVALRSSETTPTNGPISSRTTQWPIPLTSKSIRTLEPSFTTKQPIKSFIDITRTTTTPAPTTKETLATTTAKKGTSAMQGPVTMRTNDTRQSTVGATTVKHSTQGPTLTEERATESTFSRLTVAPVAQTLPPLTPSVVQPVHTALTAAASTQPIIDPVRYKATYQISWDEVETEEQGHSAPVEPMQRHEQPTPRKTGQCQDTLATISEPVTQNTYGKNQGAWMKDPKSKGDKIYVADNYYGNILLEFKNMDVFKQGRYTNSYKLPYNWIGTGHVVFNGAFYYNRAFSRDIIKYDLRRRYVAAWTMLDNAVFEDSSPWEWGGHSNIDFSVDESGLWILYPAQDEEGFLEEVIILSRLDPSDLSQDRQTTWRTALRRNHYGNCFVVCGVLYAVDSDDQRDAKLAYAFDTHTHTQMAPGMPFVNNYSYTTQIDYNPREGVLYAWDNGHQVIYNVKFAYVDP
ncbi:Olfactomedin-like protein 2B [Merluccius polli]|uniref:Olfactomedin-like protein 2B n=1 Tax=Merluccius polli TaxID=89951 RepID=A0AA47P660_MERPO|nr:Olfactomedin-like protein 2B [Merluccius polli]